MENFEIKIFEDSDYPMLCAWWVQQKWTPPAKPFLSNYGMIAYHDGKPICCAWLYLTNSKFAYIEFLVVNPSAPLRIRPRAIKYLLGVLEKEAWVLGARVVISFLSSPGLIRQYKKAGFQANKSPVYEMVKTCPV